MKNKIYNKLSFIFLLICCSLLYIVLLSKSLDNDMYFEIMSGRDLLSGNFSTASHLGDFPIIVQQWLYAVSLALFDKLGHIGLISFVFIQNSILWILSSIFIYRKTKNKKLAMFGSFFAILFCHNYMINIRPQIITMILLVTELLLVEIYKEKHKLRYLIAVFPILILAANFHQAVFLYHLIILVPYFIDKRHIDYSLLNNTSLPKNDISYKFDWKLALCSVGYLACSLCTPYGINGTLYIIKTFKSNTYNVINISEIGSIDIISYFGFKLMILAGLAIYLLYKHKIDKHTTYFIFLLTILSLISIRHISIAFIPIMYILAKIDISKFKNPYVYGCISLVCIASCMINFYQSSINLVYGDVANIIEDHDSKIFNSAMDLGGWLEYNGYTNVKYDSRCEAFSKEISGVDNMIEDYIITSTGYDIDGKQVEDNEVMTIVNEYDYVISTKASYINHVITWNKIYEDDNYIIWENSK